MPPPTTARSALGMTRARLLLLGLDPGPSVPQRDDPVEDETLGRRVLVDAEVAETLELQPGPDGPAGEARLEPARLENFLRFRIEVVEQVALRPGIGAAEEVVVEPDLGRNGVRGRDPVQSGLGRAPVGRRAAASRGIVRAAELDHLAAIVLHHLLAGDEVRRAQSHLAARREPVEL